MSSELGTSSSDSSAAATEGPSDESAGSSAGTPHAHASRGRWGVLRHPHYRNMLGAQFVSNIGGWMEMFGMQQLVAEKTGSLKALGYLGAAQLIPILLFGMLGGLVADRVNRKKLLIATQMLLMLVAGAVAALSATGFGAPRAVLDAWESVGGVLRIPEASHIVVPLLILSWLNGTVLAFNMPAWQVLTPRLVPRDELTQAITLNGVQFNLSRVIGPATSGVVYASFGPTPLFIVNALSFLGVVLTATTTPDAPAPTRPPKHPWHDVMDAVRFILHSPGPRAVFFAMTVMSFLAAPLIRVLPLFVIDVYQAAPARAEKVSSWLLALQGIGAVAGGLSLRLIPTWYPRHHFIPMAIMAAGLSISLFAGTTAMIPGFVAMLVCGFFWIWAFNQSWAAMQTLVNDHLRGRVMALANVFAFGATAVGSVILGWIGDGLKEPHGPLSAGRATQWSILSLSIPLFLAGIAMLSFRTPEVDGMPRVLPNGQRPTRNFIKAILASEYRPRATGESDAAGRL